MRLVPYYRRCVALASTYTRQAIPDDTGLESGDNSVASSNPFSKEAIQQTYREIKETACSWFGSARAYVTGLKYYRTTRRWLSAALLILGGILLGFYLEKEHAFLDIRYKAHQLTQEFGSKLRGNLYDHNTILVLIADDDYWAGSFKGRRPIDKNSLADLVSKLDEYNPKVIALDFDLRSPMPDGSLVEYEAYTDETKRFAQVVKDVSSRRRVVLPKTLAYDGAWITESEKYDQQDLGDARFGYIALYDDYRVVPASVALKDGTRLDSFSQAIVRAFDLTGTALQFDRQDNTPTFAGPYLYEDQFVQYSAGEVLDPVPATHRELADKVSGKIVIIGGVWSRLAYGRGARIDERDTPAGTMPAVFLHANWVESILQPQTARPVNKWIAGALEVMLGFLGYYVFTYRMRWYWKGAYALGVILFWLVVAYVSAQNFGLFFDPFTPTLISLGKAGYEEMHERWKDANKYRKLQEAIKSQQKRLDPITSLEKKEIPNASPA